MGKYAKAIVAALTLFGTQFAAATLDASPAGEAVSTNEWVLIAVGTVVVGVAVWATTNTPPGPVE
jgi:ribosomal silencing factor RsfS